jgi:hypothetical protein
LKERQILEGDEMGRFRIKPVKRKGRWISPDIEKILRESGIEVDEARADAATDENLEQL